MKWRVVEKRYRRRQTLPVRFIARHFNENTAKALFAYMAENKITTDISHRHNGSDVLWDSLTGVLDSSGLPSCRYDLRVSWAWLMSRRTEWGGNGLYGQHEQIDKIGEKIDRIYERDYLKMPITSKKCYLLEKNAKNRKLVKCQEWLLETLIETEKLQESMDRRIGKSRRGRRIVLAVCPPDISADYPKATPLSKDERLLVERIKN